MKILLSPDAADGGAAAAAVAENPQGDAMDAVLDKLGLPKELKGEDRKPTGNEGNKGTPAAEEAAAAAVAEQARVAGLTAEEKAAEEQASLAKAATETFLETLTAEDRAALEAMSEEERTTTIERLRAEDANEETGKRGDGAPEFSPEQKAWLDAQGATAKQELDAARAEVERLKGEAQAAATQPVQAANVHPMFLVDDARKIDEMDAQFGSFERWALANWDGTEAIEAQGNQAAIPAYSGAQVRERYAAVKEMREKLVPAAKQAIELRAQQQAVARQQYPELFDGKRPEAKLAQDILRMAPVLKVIFPNIWTVIGDALVGEKLRVAKAKAKTTGQRTTDQKTNRIAPRVAPRPGAGNRIAAAGKAKKEEGISAKRFAELGGDRNALIQMLQNADLPMATKDAA